MPHNRGGPGPSPENPNQRPGPGARPCQTCHGHKTILQQTKPGKWERVTCPACRGTGYSVV